MILKLDNGKKVSLKFKKQGKDVTVIACDKQGKWITAGFLVRFNASGNILVEPSVNNELGFQLDERGRIKIS